MAEAQHFRTLCRHKFSHVQNLSMPHRSYILSGEGQKGNRLALARYKLNFKSQVILVAMDHGPYIVSFQIVFFNITSKYDSIQFTYHFLIPLLFAKLDRQ